MGGTGSAPFGATSIRGDAGGPLRLFRGAAHSRWFGDQPERQFLRSGLAE